MDDDTRRAVSTLAEAVLQIGSNELGLVHRGELRELAGPQLPAPSTVDAHEASLSPASRVALDDGLLSARTGGAQYATPFVAVPTPSTVDAAPKCATCSHAPHVGTCPVYAPRGSGGNAYGTTMWPCECKNAAVEPLGGGHTPRNRSHPLRRRGPGGRGADDMRIYVASSWRNEQQPSVVAALRKAGHRVYDFRNPAPGKAGFGWRKILADPPPWPAITTRDVLRSAIADDGFALDYDAMYWADACVMLQPCGRSAALELGWFAGRGKLAIALLADGQEPELMLKVARLCVSLDEVIEVLREVEST